MEHAPGGSLRHLIREREARPVHRRQLGPASVEASGPAAGIGVVNKRVNHSNLEQTQHYPKANHPPSAIVGETIGLMS